MAEPELKPTKSIVQEISRRPIPGSAHLNATMGALCAAGGILAYARTGSTPSLIGGVSIGAIYGLATYNIYQYNMQTGHLIGALASGLTLGIMGRRYMATNKFMPAGMLTVAGGAVGAYNFKKFADWSDFS